MSKDSPTCNCKKIAWLIDPEKVEMNEKFKSQLISFPSDQIILVGGSTCKEDVFKKIISFVYKHSSCLVLIFPGSNKQISQQADGILLLSLISGRNPTYLIDQHVEAAELLMESNLKILPTGYILIDGGKQSTTSKVTSTEAIKMADENLIVSTALAGAQLGMSNIYLESGSGALVHVNKNIIFKVKQKLSTQTLWVGGGIKSPQQIATCFNAGANVVVIGNAIESTPSLLNDIFKK